ncbi:TrmB family transcriptional regulator [Candidatus Woesearchaeota archaeon]|nr:TrmB family transcriptional regulator [Candidatus Woesearchaeota archaeon]
MEQKNIDLLKAIGLTDGEVKVYLALIDLGSSTTGNIIQKSKVHASKVYSILNRLIEKGLVSFIKKEKKTVYSSNPPTTITSYLNRKELEIKEQKESARDFIEELSRKTFANISEATVYLGIKGLRTASEKMYEKMRKGDTLYYLGVPAYQPEEQHIYWQKDHARRIEHGIKVRILFNQDTDPKILRNRNTYQGSDARHMPTKIKTPALFGIYKDVVLVMLQSPEVITIEIINQHIADSFKAYFNEFWKNSKPFRK